MGHADQHVLGAAARPLRGTRDALPHVLEIGPDVLCCIASTGDSSTPFCYPRRAMAPLGDLELMIEWARDRTVMAS